MTGFIRTAIPEDAPSIAAVDRIVFGANAYSEMYFYEVLRFSGLFVLINETSEKKITGYCIIFQYQESRSCGFIGSLGVLPENHRSGIGSALMNRAGAQLKEFGYSELRLLVSPENSDAISLYKSLDFSSISTIADAYGIGNDRILMRKTL